MQKINDPTHRGGHTLDHVYVNDFQLEIECEVLPTSQGLTTDHLPVILKIPTPTSQNTTQTMTFRRLKDIDLAEFRKDLELSYKEMDTSHNNFRNMYLEYHEVTQAIVDKHGPVLTRKKRNSEAAWIDREYRENRTKRRQLERKWKKNRSEENRNNYINQKNVCTDLAIRKQTHYYSKLVEDSSGSQRTLFKMANELLDKNSEKVLPTHDDPKQLANDFNRFFIDKVNKIRDSIPEEKDKATYYSRPFKGKMLMEFEPTTEEELSKIISHNGVKTCMEDPIPSKLFMSVIDIVLPVIKKLVNQSLAKVAWIE